MIQSHILIDEYVGIVDDRLIKSIFQIMAVFMDGCKNLPIIGQMTIHQSKSSLFELDEDMNTGNIGVSRDGISQNAQTV